MLDRETLWRQGSIFRTSDAQAIGLFEPNDIIAIMVSHDCDIPSAHETDIEIILGRICKREKMFANCRNPRRLHLTYSKDGNEITIDLFQSNKQSIEKSRMEGIGLPDDSYTLADDQKRALKQWLAARYGRPAYPNSFERRLTSRDTKKIKLEREVATVLAEASDHIISVFFDLDADRYNELPDDEPYILRILVVYDAIEGGPEARGIAEDAAQRVSGLFYERFGYPDNATDIILETCTAVADTSISLSDVRKMDQWRVEYVSLQDEPPTAFLPTGT